MANQENPANRIPVSEIMTAPALCVKKDTGLDALERLLMERGFSGAPVVDEEGRPVGVVSKTDLLQGRGSSGARPLTVADIMMPTAFCMQVEETVGRAAGLMAYEAVHRMPVVNREGRVIGVVSPLDILRWLARECGYPIANRG